MAVSLWLDVYQQFLGPFYEVVIAGDLTDIRTQALLAVYRKRFPSYSVLILVPAGGPTSAQAQLLPVTKGKTAVAGLPTAYVCQFQSCKRPWSPLGCHLTMAESRLLFR